MYQSMLFIHWKQIRLVLIPFVVAAFALPLLSVQGLGGTVSTSQVAYRAMAMAQLWLPLYPMLAAALGVTLGLSAWNWDHQLKHVYALSLPLARWEYVLLKMGAGAALALLPSMAFWTGAHVATLSIDLPAGLNAYPNELALRFFLAVLVSYAITFAGAAGTVRTTVIVFTAFWVLLALVAVMDELVLSIVPSLQHADPVNWIMTLLVERPGPFAVFTGNWSLLDV